MQNNNDVLARAYATLSALRKNVDNILPGSVSEIYVREFHNVLDKLGNIGIDLSEFRIPSSEIKPHVTAISWGNEGKETRYSEEKYVDKPLILTKIDAILSYFEITMSQKPSIGFHSFDES